MNLTPIDQARIIEQESAWIDSSFGGVDLSGFPSLNELPAQPKDADSFARPYGDTALRRSAHELRSFLENPDVSAMEESGSEALLRDVRDRRAEEVVQAFKRECPDYLPTDENFRSMVTTLAYNALPDSEQHADPDTLVDRLIERGYWTVDNLTRVYQALNREALLDIPAGEPRNLTDRERLRVSRMAQAGQVESAVGEFLRCSLDGDEPSAEFASDPKYRSLCDDACYYVFCESQLDFVETASRRAYLLRYAGNRPLTIPLLQQAWKSCQQNEARHDRSAVLNQLEQPQPARVSAEQLDGLDDSAVDRLYHDSLRAYADSVRRVPGVLA